MRLHDNSALNMALKNSEVVTPVFIFDERQISKKNLYFSDPAFQFMIKSLQELDDQLDKKNSQLSCFFGVAEKVIEELFNSFNFDALFIRRKICQIKI